MCISQTTTHMHGHHEAAMGLAGHQGHQPLREERVAKAVPGLAHRVGAEWVARSARWGQPHRSNAQGWCCRRFDSDTQTRCGSVTVMVLVSSASGPRVSGCPRAPRPKCGFEPKFSALGPNFSHARMARACPSPARSRTPGRPRHHH
eukprot:scaffold91672_cov33-Phaeocystis_antarctica.AAC.1